MLGSAEIGDRGIIGFAIFDVGVEGRGAIFVVLNGAEIFDGVVVRNNCDGSVLLLVVRDHLLDALNPPPESEGIFQNLFIFQ